MKKLTKELFIEKYYKKFPNSNIVFTENFIYTKSIDKSIFFCSKCQSDFVSTPHDILSGRGCPKCAGRVFGSSSLFIEKYYKKFPNSNIVFTENFTYKAKEKSQVYCKKCGNSWELTPEDLLAGHSCPECAGRVEKSIEKFSKKYYKKFPNSSIEILDSNYSSSKEKIRVKCTACDNILFITPDNLMQGRTCMKCSKRTSKQEREILNILNKKHIKFVHQKKFADCKDKKLLSYDFYIPSKNLLIEYNGKQHYEPVEAFGGEEQLHVQRHHDWLKRKFARDNHISLLVISYKDDKNIERILEESIIANFLHPPSSQQ